MPELSWLYSSLYSARPPARLPGRESTYLAELSVVLKSKVVSFDGYTVDLDPVRHGGHLAWLFV